jgi:protein O-mannosyl-transferase
LYRPLSLVMFAGVYQFAGDNPLPYHCLNILLFACCVVLLFVFLNTLFAGKKTAVAFIASLLFALHPIHTEVVANVKSCDELLCFFFAFLCLNVFAAYSKTGKIYLLFCGALCFFLSLLSKETVITFVAIIPLIFFFYKKESAKRSVAVGVTTVVTAVSFLALRFSVLHFYHADLTGITNVIDNALAKEGLPLDSRLATAILISGNYLKLLVVPYPLTSDYSFNSIPYTDFSDPRVLLSLGIYIFLIVFSIKRFLKDRSDPFAFAIFFFLLSLSLFTNILFLLGTLMAERLMFFPSVGFCLLIALIAERLAGGTKTENTALLRNQKVAWAIIPVYIIYALLTFNRNSDWTDNLTLYSSDVKKSPDNSRLNTFIGAELFSNAINEKNDLVKQKQTEEAIKYLSRALEIYPGNSEADNDLGSAYYSTGNYQQAIICLKKAVKINPIYELAYYNLGLNYKKLKQYDSAILCLRQAIALDPNSIAAHEDLGLAFLYKQNYDSAEAHLKLALTGNPDYLDGIFNLGIAYASAQKNSLAIEQFKNVIAKDPGYINAFSSLGNVCFSIQQFQSAIDAFTKELALDPNRLNDVPSLAISWQKAGNADSARKYETIAQKSNPGFKL